MPNLPQEAIDAARKAVYAREANAHGPAWFTAIEAAAPFIYAQSEEDYVVAREVEKATEPGKWFQAIDEDGNLLAETSNPRDFGPDSLDLIGKPGVTFRRQYRAELEDWREIDATDLPMTPRNKRRL